MSKKRYLMLLYPAGGLLSGVGVGLGNTTGHRILGTVILVGGVIMTLAGLHFVNQNRRIGNRKREARTVTESVYDCPQAGSCERLDGPDGKCKSNGPNGFEVHIPNHAEGCHRGCHRGPAPGNGNGRKKKR